MTKDELLQINDELSSEINSLKEKLDKFVSDKDSDSKKMKDSIAEIETLRKEKDDLLKQIESITEERKKDKDLMISVMRNYSIKTNDPGFFGDDGKTQEEKDYEQAEKNINDWVKNFTNTGKIN